MLYAKEIKFVLYFKNISSILSVVWYRFLIPIKVVWILWFLATRKFIKKLVSFIRHLQKMFCNFFRTVYARQELLLLFDCHSPLSHLPCTIQLYSPLPSFHSAVLYSSRRRATPLNLSHKNPWAQNVAPHCCCFCCRVLNIAWQTH